MTARTLTHPLLADLHPFPGNPRRGDVSAIAESLERNEQFRPLVVQRSTGYVLDGNHTLQAMISLGWKRADAYVVDVDDQAAKRIVAAANRIADRGSYDDADLLALLGSIDDLDGTGYADDDLAKLVAAQQTTTVRQHQRRAATPSEPGTVEILHGDSLELLGTLDAGSVDAVVTDPPYGLDFMGKAWDRFTAAEFEAFSAQWATECLRVLKPGGHLIAFGSPRTAHRLTAGIEDAGFEIRDSIAWLSSKTFPKSRNLTRDWEGWGTGLKPSFEPVTLARKPLQGTLQHNVETWHTGALNIDAARISTTDRLPAAGGEQFTSNQVFSPNLGVSSGRSAALGARWPANAASDERVAEALASMAPNFVYTAKAASREKPWDDEGTHPTVKPVELMRWLVRLVTRPGGLVLDPFAGSGTTAEAAVLEGMRVTAIEREERYVRLIRQRVADAKDTAE